MVSGSVFYFQLILRSFPLISQIDESDRFPKKICVSCLEKLCEIYAFRLGILRANNELYRIENLQLSKESSAMATLPSANEQSDINELGCAEDEWMPMSSSPLTQIIEKMKIISKNKINCNICEKYFVGKDRFEQHLIRKHTARNDVNVLKPYECDVCDKAYTTMANLNIHKVTHSGEF